MKIKSFLQSSCRNFGLFTLFNDIKSDNGVAKDGLAEREDESIASVSLEPSEILVVHLDASLQHTTLLTLRWTIINNTIQKYSN